LLRRFCNFPYSHVHCLNSFVCPTSYYIPSRHLHGWLICLLGHFNGFINSKCKILYFLTISETVCCRKLLVKQVECDSLAILCIDSSLLTTALFTKCTNEKLSLGVPSHDVIDSRKSKFLVKYTWDAVTSVNKPF